MKKVKKIITGFMVFIFMAMVLPNDNGESFGGERSGGKKNVYSDIPCGKCCKF